MAFLLSVLGVVLIIEGIPYFAFPRKMKEWALTLQEVSIGTMRGIGIFSMAAGLFILFMVKVYMG